MNWASSTGETVDQVDVALGYVYGPGNQLIGENDTITSTDPTMTPANWSGSFGMEQPAPTAVAIGVAIPGIGVGVGNVADCPYLADAWADSSSPLVDPSDVAAGYQYGPINRPFFGTNEGITSDDPPVVPESWMGTFCGLLPALSAVAEGVVIPGVGVGTAEVFPGSPDMPTPADKLDPLNCGQLQLIRGDDYTGDRAKRFAFSSSVAPQPNDVATWTWTDPYCDEAIGELTTSDFEQIGKYEYVAKFEATSFASDNRPGQWPFDVQLSIANADTRTIATGILDLIVDQTR